MSRIRSIHPGIYTDEDWAGVSVAARWLGVGLMTIADDNGIFEWKPLQIKMTIFPADAIDVAALLGELEQAGRLIQFTDSGKRYGAIRNFLRYQRPRKPKAWHPFPDAIKPFVGSGSELASDETGAVPQKSELPSVESKMVPQPSEKCAQREEGGGMREDEKGKQILQAQQPTIPAAAPADLKIETEEVRRRCEQAAGREFPHFQSILTLVDQGVDLDRRILPIIRDVMEACRRTGREPPTSWRYFEQPIMDSERLVRSAVPSKPAADLLFLDEGSPDFLGMMTTQKASFYRSIMCLNPDTGKPGLYIKPDVLEKLRPSFGPTDAERAA